MAVMGYFAVAVGFGVVVLKKMTENAVEIIPLQIMPQSLYKIGTGEGFRLRYGADIDSQDLLVIAIKASVCDPRKIAQAVEQYLIRQNIHCLHMD